ncbi:MAG: outer membrane beta-barrel protein, partial [Tidjanibacter sp.]|nr:outer membrane beta-barrel protein [Tidjanibacter sp.]
EYSYQVGNPDLRPVYVDDLSLSAVLMYRYTVTLGAQVQHDNISQLALVDEADPTGRTLMYLHKNLDNLNQYYIQLIVPAQPTPWWTINANLMGVWLRQRIAQGEPMDNSLTAHGYMTNTFTLPRGWIIDLTGQFMTDAHVGNLTQKGTGYISLAVKKRMLSDKLTLSVGVNNLLDVDKVVYAEGPGFSKRLVEDNIWVRSVNVALRYNFNAGKAFQSRNVESGAADEALRIGNSK